jgi:tripartite ATP-independent transporter DctM subunit
MTFIFLVFALFIASGIPIAFCLMIPSYVYLYQTGNIALMSFLIPERMVAGISSFVLLAIPLFFIGGDLMVKTGLTRELIRFCNLFVGRFRGGLAQINVLACMIFSGISGTGVADTASIGKVLIPAMKEEGYDVDFACGVTCAASVMGPLIPPSVPAVIYGHVMNLSIGGLFLSLLIPGVIIGIGLMVVNYVLAVKRHFPIHVEKIKNYREAISIIGEGLVCLTMPVIIVGGILGGIFTVTEAAAVACFYAFIYGLVRRTLKFSDLPRIFLDAAVGSSIVYLIIGAAQSFAWIVTIEQVPALMAKAVLAFSSNPVVIVLLLNLLLLIVGCLMETTSAILIFAPLLTPIAMGIGMRPELFATIMVVNLCVGLITPPVGVCLFVASGISGRPIEKIAKATVPFLLVELGVILLISFVPSISMTLPKLAGFFK